jgi:hypothetical protein
MEMAGRAKNLVLVVVAVVLWAASASAEIVTIGLTAEITYIDPYDEWLNEQFDIGDIITGGYTYDTDTWDTNPSGSVGDYIHTSSPYGINLSINGFTFQTDPANVYFLVEICDNHLSSDHYLLISYANLPLPNGFCVGQISWQLDDSSGTALSSTDLPTIPPVLEQWQSVYGLRIIFGEKSAGPLLQGEVTSVQLLPEPCILIMLALGSAVLLRQQNSQVRRKLPRTYSGIRVA